MNQPGQKDSGLCFVCDAMLGKLARALRMIGFPAHYCRGNDREDPVRLARDRNGLLLTRDTRLIRRKDIEKSLFIWSDHCREQLAQTITELNLSLDPERFFTICLLCNRFLTSMKKADVRGLAPPYVYYRTERFSRCSKCERIYWAGDHKRNMDAMLKSVVTMGEP